MAFEADIKSVLGGLVQLEGGILVVGRVAALLRDK
jgi:hypothetical protein